MMENNNSLPPPIPPRDEHSNHENPYDEVAQNHLTQPPQIEDAKDEIPPLKPNNWLWQSILATLFCCIFFGIIGIVYAARVDSFYYRGMYAEAEQFARKARMWTLLAVASMVVYLVIWIIMISTGNLPEHMENFMENNASGYNF